jgi:hypothetical protein
MRQTSAKAWIAIRSRRRADAAVVCGSFRECWRRNPGASLTRLPADLDASLLDAPALIALADGLRDRPPATVQGTS